jgi:hypothetical protein
MFMLHNKKIFASLFPILFIIFTCCKKDDKEPINIILYNKSLKTIQHYSQGKWKLQYSLGGIIAQKNIDKNNSYMLLTPNHIILGNDSLGVVVDTSIIWEKTKIENSEFTYLLSFSWVGYSWPEHYLIDKIKNDTLIIRNHVSDGLSYFYTKY